MQLDTILLDTYEYMQIFAVGLEQIVWDQEDYNLRFQQQFQDTEFKLRTVSTFFIFVEYLSLGFIEISYFMKFDFIEAKRRHDFHNNN